MNILKFLILSWAASTSLYAADAAIEIRLVVPAETQGAIEKKSGETILWVEPKASFDSKDVKSAFAIRDPNGFVVMINFTDDAAMRFGDFSKAHVGSRLAILSYGNLISAPILAEAITGGSIQISGGFTLEEARELAKAIEGEKPKAQNP